MPIKHAGMTVCLGLLLIGLTTPNRAAAEGDQEYEFRYRFEVGQTVHYSVESKVSLVLQQGQSEQHIAHGTLTDKQYRVKSIDADGNAVLELQIDRARMEAEEDGGGKVTYDTASGEDPPKAFQGITATIGKPHARVKLTPTGELLSIDWLAGSQQQSPPTSDDAAVLDIMAVLPEHSVTVGQSWKQQYETRIAATPTLKKTVKLQREYTLKKVDGNLATIALRTMVLTPLHDAAQESQLVGKTPSGTIEFDLSRCVVTSRTLHVDKTVVGFDGTQSRVHTISNLVEQLASIQLAGETAETAATK